jgi:hypothetical protein
VGYDGCDGLCRQPRRARAYVDFRDRPATGYRAGSFKPTAGSGFPEKGTSLTPGISASLPMRRFAC